MGKYIALIASSLLSFFGWQPISKEFKDTFRATTQRVVIFPHTTYWDFPIMLIYALTSWSDYNSVYVVMKPQLASGPLGWFFRWLHCIPSTRREDSGKGFVKEVVDRLSRLSNYTLVIAPEGTVDRKEWRSGYFHLAKELGCPIQVMGLDYNHHCLVTKDPLVIVDNYEATEQQLKRLIATIPMLHPERSVTDAPNCRTSLYNNPQFDYFLLVLNGIAKRMLCCVKRFSLWYDDDWEQEE